jgi:hypothetical protein
LTYLIIKILVIIALITKTQSITPMHLKPFICRISMLFCALFCTALTVCAQKVIPVDTSHCVTLRLDPANAMGGNASDYFEEVNYIPLETTGESEFGSISQLEVTDEYYIIFDQNTKAILLFTRAGKFHTKIKGNTKYGIYNFTYNKFTKQIIYYNNENATTFYCDLNGKVVKTIKRSGELGKDEKSPDGLYHFSADQAIGIGSYNTLDTTDKRFKTYSNSLIHYVKDDKTVYQKGLSFSKQLGAVEAFYYGKAFTMAGNDTTFFYSKPLSFSIYTVTPNTIKFSYKLIFPFSVSLPKDFLTNADYNKERRGYYEKHPNQLFSLTNIFRTGNNLSFEAGNLWDYRNKENTLIYNLATGSLVAYKHVLADERSYYLPLIESLGYSFGSVLIASDGEHLYASVSSLSMFKAHEDSADKKVKYPADLDEYFKKRNRRDNPVIIQMKLKNQW